MELTKELLSRFVGGQIEVQNKAERYVFRGEIEEATVAGNELGFKLKWMAEGNGYPPTRWTVDDDLEYSVSLEIYTAQDIGPSGSDIGGSNRIMLTSPIMGEVATMFPADGSKLDPSKVEGLKLD